MSRSFTRSKSAISIASILSISESVATEVAHARHILVPIDNSVVRASRSGRGLRNSCRLLKHTPTLQSSKDALQWAITQVYRPGDKFHLLHVIPEPDTLHPWPGVYIPPDDAQEREEFKHALAMVRSAFAPPLQAARVPADVHLIVATDATDTIANIILDKAEDLPAALVVMASSGKQGLVELWLGSVTRRVTRLTSKPVTVYPPHA